MASSPLPPWNLAQRVAFRFLFAYWLLYLLPYPLTAIPGIGWFGGFITDLWSAVVPLFGNHVLGIERAIANVQTGSGDTTFAFVELLLKTLIAVAVTAIWSVFDRRRTRYDRLDDALRIYVRYALGVILISYGMVKVIKLQFPFPSEGRLIEPFGESSPMGLLWTFMGYSAPYNVFTGGAECLAGLLLLFRRTTVLGACIAIGVMSNVVMLNFSYDVPVKLFSIHLLAMAVFLLTPHAHRLVALFVLNQPVSPAPPRPPLRARWMERARPFIKATFILWVMYEQISGALDRRAMRQQSEHQHAISGLYMVETMIEDGVPRPPLATDMSRWHLTAITTYKGLGMFRVRRMDGTMAHFRFQLDEQAQTLSMKERSPGTHTLELRYDQTGPDQLYLTGTADQRPIAVELRRLERSFLLVDRGFHWINEYPLNR